MDVLERAEPESEIALEGDRPEVSGIVPELCARPWEAQLRAAHRLRGSGLWPAVLKPNVMLDSKLAGCAAGAIPACDSHAPGQVLDGAA